MTQDNLRFSDFLSGKAADPAPEEQQEVVEGVTEDDAELTEEVETEEVAEEDVQVEQAAPSPDVARVTLEDRMRAKGLAVPEDVIPEDFYDQAIERIAAGTQAMHEARQLREEIERLKAPSPVPTAPAPTEQAPAAKDEAAAAEQERMFLELHEYDPNLLSYVTRSEDGRAIPRPDYGSTAVDAANAINNYEKAERQQAKRLLRNPNLLIQDNISSFEKMAEQKAQAIFDTKIKAWQEEQAQAETQRQKAAAEQKEHQLLSEFHDTHKAKLFNLGADGEPLRSPFDENQFSTTQVGRHFLGRLNELRQELPGANELTLRGIAMREAEYSNPAPAAAPAPEPVGTPAEQQKKFVQQRQPVPHQNVPAASALEVSHGRQSLKFADMVRSDPNNQEIIAGWK